MDPFQIKIYVACAIHGQDHHFAFRNLVVTELQRLGYQTLRFFSDFTEEERAGLNVYEWDMRTVGEADLVVALVDGPSSGVGMELREADHRRIPAMVFTRRPENVSRIIVDRQRSLGQHLNEVPTSGVDDAAQAFWIADWVHRELLRLAEVAAREDTAARRYGTRLGEALLRTGWK